MSSTSMAHASGLRSAGRAAVRLVVLPALVIGTAGALAAAPAEPAGATTPPGSHARLHHRHPPRAHHQRHHHRHPHRKHRAHLGRSAGRESHAMRIAVAQKGKPYVYGAAGPGAYDCSGLTSFAFHHAGFGAMPRTAAGQAHFVRRIPRSRMHRGDLIFFYGSGGVYHVGLYAGRVHGRRLVLHAPYPGQRVKTEALWTNAWFPGTLRYR
jgi:cell wall-associated NlpC family hydrolase